MEKKLEHIKLIIFDVDGVLTDGKIYLPGDSEELKVFYAKDFPRLQAALRSGLKIVFFTGRKGNAVIRRAKEFTIPVIFKRDLKDQRISLYEEIKKRYNIEPESVMYVGDDWNDLYYMKQAGISVTPADGSNENKQIADIITRTNGGHGVAAEIIEKVMKAQKTWDNEVGKYFSELLF